MFFSQYFKSRWERLSLAAVSWLLLVAFTRAGLGIKLPRLLGAITDPIQRRRLMAGFLIWLRHLLGIIPDHIQRRRLRAGEDPCPEVIRYASTVAVIGFSLIAMLLSFLGYEFQALLLCSGVSAMLIFQKPILYFTRPVRMKNVAKRLGVSLG